MIKFVCSSCGERLSVPDQHGGRKGVCPTCQAVNRIPLKGFAETQPNAPVVARPGEKPAAPATTPQERGVIRGALSIPALSGRVDEPEPAASDAAAASSTLVPDDTAASSQVPDAPTVDATAAAFIENVTAPAKTVSSPIAQSDEPALVAPAPIDESQSDRPVREWHIPKPVKIALLVIVALAIVGALYLGLLFALRALVPTS